MTPAPVQVQALIKTRDDPTPDDHVRTPDDHDSGSSYRTGKPSNTVILYDHAK